MSTKVIELGTHHMQTRPFPGDLDDDGCGLFSDFSGVEVIGTAHERRLREFLNAPRRMKQGRSVDQRRDQEGGYTKLNGNAPHPRALPNGLSCLACSIGAKPIRKEGRIL